MKNKILIGIIIALVAIMITREVISNKSHAEEIESIRAEAETKMQEEVNTAQLYVLNYIVSTAEKCEPIVVSNGTEQVELSIISKKCLEEDN